MNNLSRWLWALMAALTATSVLAENAGRGVAGLPDPTRPSTAMAVVDVPEDGKSGEAPSSGLQTVIMRKGGTPLAIINGQTVALGDKVGEARLVSLSETEAVLQGPNGKEVLRMISEGVVKTAVVPPVAEAGTQPAAKRARPAKKHKPKLTK